MSSDPDTRLVFPGGSINVTYWRSKNLEELISPSLFAQPHLATKSLSMISKCGKNATSVINFVEMNLLLRILLRHTRWEVIYYVKVLMRYI